MARRQSARRRRTPRPPDPGLELCHRRRKIAPPLDRDLSRTSRQRGLAGPEGAKAVYARTRDLSPISSSARKRGRGPWWRTPRRSASATVWRPPCWHYDPNCERPDAGADHRSSRHSSSQERRRFAAGRRSAFLGYSRTTASGRWPAPSPLDPECRASFASPLRIPGSKRSRLPGWPRHPKLAERRMAERVGFEPTVPFRARLISSQVR